LSKLAPKFDVLVPPKILQRTAKFLTEFYKYWSPWYMWQSLVTIDEKPRRLDGEKRKKENLNKTAAQQSLQNNTNTKTISNAP